jgi:hypothetical protein
MVSFEELMTHREDLNIELSIYVSEASPIGKVLRKKLFDEFSDFCG